MCVSFRQSLTHASAIAKPVVNARFAVAGMTQDYCSVVVVRKRGRKTAVRFGLGKQRVGLGLKCLHGVSARSEACGRLLDRVLHLDPAPDDVSPEISAQANVAA